MIWALPPDRELARCGPSLLVTLDSGYVSANGVRLHYLRSGGDKPPLVLAHGFSDSAACWASLIPALRDDYDVVAYDARGHGLSEAPEFGYQTDSRVADLLGLVAALGLALRDATLAHITGAGHNVRRDNRVQTLEVLRRFLARL